MNPRQLAKRFAEPRVRGKRAQPSKISASPIFSLAERNARLPGLREFRDERSPPFSPLLISRFQRTSGKPWVVVECARGMGRAGTEAKEGSRRVERRGNTKGGRRVRAESERGTEVDSFDSVRFELAGFGEYGSFVVPAEGAPRRLPAARSRAERNETDRGGASGPATWPLEDGSGGENRRNRGRQDRAVADGPTETTQEERTSEPSKRRRNYGTRTCCS